MLDRTFKIFVVIALAGLIIQILGAWIFAAIIIIVWLLHDPQPDSVRDFHRTLIDLAEKKPWEKKI